MSQEPEFSVQGRSKEFSDQEAILKAIATSLPYGTKLVYKEHGTIGARSTSFYKRINHLPNVIMAHPSLRGIDLARNAICVLTFGGTVALEALNFGKPVIVFSKTL